MTSQTIIIFVVLFIFFMLMYSIINKILYGQESSKICNCNKKKEYYSGDQHVSSTKNINNHFYYRCKNHIFNNYEDSDEVPERLSAYLFIEPNDKVLEIGGNIGGVSAIIADKLSNSKNLVVIEPSDLAVINLKKLSQIHNFNVHHGVIVGENENLQCQLSGGNYFACYPVDYKVGNNITFSELQEKYDMVFDTLVIDCEGCYESIFKNAIDSGRLNQIRKIIIEWDGEFMEKLLIDN